MIYKEDMNFGNICVILDNYLNHNLIFKRFQGHYQF